MCLIAEISSHHQNHLRLIKYSHVASLIGSSSVLFCGMVSTNMENFKAFQAFTVLIAVISCICMMYTGMYSESRFDSKIIESDVQGCTNQVAGKTACSIFMLKSLTWQILTNKDFQLFVMMNFFQVFMLAFFDNFTMIFTEHLIPPDALPSLAKNFMYGAEFILPQLLVLSSQSLLHSIGYYRIILFIFILEAGMAALMLALGPQRYYFLAFFLTINMVIIQAAFSLFGLPLADIIDIDLQKYKHR
ncbi:uncharacterized protein LOC124864711 [Girardinichthys multiradiatus]|uniref:uncharacterized protein LOC124864711 n=1 Tax=Girardinichthys multiradiatus TaxID=208333 RepID=UPI001FAC5908|nr:uncharacterized protein LOC124864711 [Girardinichthys multiradiatus]